MPAQQLLPDKRTKAQVSGAMGIPYNPSCQHLMGKDGAATDTDSNESFPSDVDLYVSYPPEGGALTRSRSSPHFISRRQVCTVLILFFVNLINYMDRLTIAGNVDKGEGGLCTKIPFSLSFF